MFDAKSAIPGVFYSFPNQIPKSTSVSKPIPIPDSTSQDTIGIKVQAKVKKRLTLTRILSLPKI
jgi:hypothetical protein